MRVMENVFRSSGHLLPESDVLASYFLVLSRVEYHHSTVCNVGCQETPVLVTANGHQDPTVVGKTYLQIQFL